MHVFGGVQPSPVANIPAATDDLAYNQRLFSGGVRGWFHAMRFTWLRRELGRLRCPQSAVLELGCFDAKLITLLPQRPTWYYGYDANWEGGLDRAKAKWGHVATYHFVECVRPEDMELPAGAPVDVAIVMETMEHIPPDLVDGFLRRLATCGARYLFITVPNEKGIVFFAKRLAKRLCGWDAKSYSYTWKEFWNATLGRSYLVPRQDHKGFDYAELIMEVRRHFDILRVSGMPVGWLPTWMGTGVGIVATPRARAATPATSDRES